ncbi:MAG: TonB-dependent receptor [Alteraurantiacibacter sp.]
MKYFVGPLVTACLAAPAAAQETVDPVGDDTIIVTGASLPETPAAPAYSTIKIDREALVTTASGRLEDALANVAGFQQFRRSDSRSSNPSAQGATLRALGGNATSRALVLLDGMPIADPFFGYIPFGAVPPETLGSVRVTRGGGSGPFGAGALAGTIRLESAGPEALRPIVASALADMRGDSELSAIAAPEIGDGFAVLHGRWDRGQGFYTTPVDQRAAASSRANYDSWSAGARIVQPLGDALEVQARVLAFDDNRTLRFVGADNSSRGQNISLRIIGRGDWAFDALGYAQWRDFSNVVISSTRFTRVLDQRDTPARGLGGKIELRPPVGDAHTLRVGADIRRSSGELFEDAYSAFSGNLTESRNAGGANTTLGLFVEDDREMGALTLTAGFRADRYWIEDGFYRAVAADGAIVRDDSFADRGGWEVTWRAGALFDASDSVRLRAAMYRGFRLPTLNELYRPFVVFPVVTQANAELEPERLQGWEVGADFAPVDNVSLSATLFDNRVESAIANVTLEENLRQRRNLDSIAARGVELAASLMQGPFAFDGTLVLTNAEVRGTGPAALLDGNSPSQTPDFAASATARYAFGQGSFASATLRHVGAQFEDELETDVLPAATTLDLYGQAALTGKLTLVARVENLFDSEIVTRNQGGSIDLGAPRTIWLGLRWGY